MRYEIVYEILGPYNDALFYHVSITLTLPKKVGQMWMTDSDKKNTMRYEIVYKILGPYNDTLFYHVSITLTLPKKVCQM